MGCELSNDLMDELEKHIDLVLTAYKAGDARLSDVREHIVGLISLASDDNYHATLKNQIGRSLTALFGDRNS